MANNSVADKMLKAVLMDKKLMAFGEYTPDDFTTMAQALISDNCIVNAVAKIIDRGRLGATESEIYREVSDYLKTNI